ncbi:MAG: hypothetical protein V3U89_07260 [Methylophilaceae bacterium]
MTKILFALFGLAFSAQCWSMTANCTIEIQDVTSGTNYTVQHKIEYTVGLPGDRKEFALPGSSYKCYFTFFTLESGTSLSCQLDELGRNYVQSDRSVISEGKAKNNLAFRFGRSNFVIQSTCK